MSARRYWIWLAAGLCLDAAVVLSPLTPYPIIQNVFDREYAEVLRGYEQLMQTGNWKAGDPGFELMRQHYMTEVVRGIRPELDSTMMHGLSLERFQVGEPESPVNNREDRPVYVIYANRQGHIVEGDQIKILTASFHKPYAMLVSIALALVATWLIYGALVGLLGPRLNAWEPGASAAADDALSRNTAS